MLWKISEKCYYRIILEEEGEGLQTKSVKSRMKPKNKNNHAVRKNNITIQFVFSVNLCLVEIITDTVRTLLFERETGENNIIV